MHQYPGLINVRMDSYFLGQSLWDHKNTKMKHKDLLISAAIVSVFYFLYMPRYGLGE